MRLIVIFLGLAIVALLASCKTTPEDISVPVDTGPDAGWVQWYIDSGVEIDLPEPFIKLVDLARLRVGMTKAEVLEIFPDPLQIELRGRDDAWQYGHAELLFRNDLLRDWFNLVH